MYVRVSIGASAPRCCRSRRSLEVYLHLHNRSQCRNRFLSQECLRTAMLTQQEKGIFILKKEAETLSHMRELNHAGMPDPSFNKQVWPEVLLHSHAGVPKKALQHAALATTLKSPFPCFNLAERDMTKQLLEKTDQVDRVHKHLQCLRIRLVCRDVTTRNRIHVISWNHILGVTRHNM